MENIKAISFDLDDSLWAIAPVIIRAEKVMHEHMRQHFPAVTDRFDADGVREMRARVNERYAHLAHDLTALRQMSIEMMLEECGYDRNHSEPLMEMFLDLRHDVEFYPDALPALEKLAKKYRLYAISNGNANVSRLGLEHLFEGQISARSEGYGKPDVRIFHTACSNLKLSHTEVLHVGDHPLDDVSGALNAGLKTVWLNRVEADWPHNFKPHFACEDLHQLVDFLGA
ncbi:MAG: 2-haloalkanoic acid dehalogenase type II [Parasphingorhabdus sp.]|jgi:2-haloalkanoic acid dehalogenase type II